MELGDTLTFYADESGNAGINYLDTEQPHHVSAGWLVESAREPAFSDIVTKFFGPGAKEVKGGDLVKRPRGQRRLVELIKDLRGLAEPFFVIYEREFSIAGRVQSTFFDAFHNPMAHWIIPGDAVHEQRVTEQLSEILSRATLARFASAYRDPTAANLLPLPVEIEQQLRRAGETHLADTMVGAIENIEQVAFHENYVDSEEGSTHAQSASKRSGDRSTRSQSHTYMDAFAPRRFDVVHDDTDQFGASICRALNGIGGAGQAYEGVMSGGVKRRFILGHLREARLAASHLTPGVRAADILGAVVRHLVRVLANGRVPGGDLRKLCKMTLIELEGDDPPRAGIYMNRKVLQATWAPAIRSTYR